MTSDEDKDSILGLFSTRATQERIQTPKNTDPNAPMRKEDLKDVGKVSSYRSTMLTLMDALGCEFEEADQVFPTDEPFNDLFL